VLRTSRFFPEEDDNRRVREAYSDASVKANEYLYRRVDIEDVVGAHLIASEQAASIGFRKYIISATTPFLPADLSDLRVDLREFCERASPNLMPNTIHRKNCLMGASHSPSDCLRNTSSRSPRSDILAGVPNTEKSARQEKSHRSSAPHLS
jgi:hypothetical protein